MIYPSFLTLMSQLVDSRFASVQIEDRLLHVEKLEKKDSWIFSTKLFTASQELLSCFSSLGVFRLQQGNVCVQLDSSTRSVYAVYNVQMPDKKYIPFKQHLTYFLGVVSNYEEILFLEPTF